MTIIIIIIIIIVIIIVIIIIIVREREREMGNKSDKKKTIDTNLHNPDQGGINCNGSIIFHSLAGEIYIK